MRMLRDLQGVGMAPSTQRLQQSPTANQAERVRRVQGRTSLGSESHIPRAWAQSMGCEDACWCLESSGLIKGTVNDS